MKTYFISDLMEFIKVKAKKIIASMEMLVIHNTWYDLRFSADGGLYYVDGKPAFKARQWMSVEKYPESLSKKMGDGISGGIMISKKGEKPYCRKTFSFMYYEIKGGESKKYLGSDDLVLDYLATCRE